MQLKKSVIQLRRERKRAKELHKLRHKKHPCTKLERFKGQFVKKGTKPGDKPRNYRVSDESVEEKYVPPTTRKMTAHPQCGGEARSSNKQKNGHGENQACQSTPRIGGGLCQPRKQLEKANSTANEN